MNKLNPKDWKWRFRIGVLYWKIVFLVMHKIENWRNSQ